MDLGSKNDENSGQSLPPSSPVRQTSSSLLACLDSPIPDPRWPGKHRWSASAKTANQTAFPNVPDSSSSPARSVSPTIVGNSSVVACSKPVANSSPTETLLTQADGNSAEFGRHSTHTIVNQSPSQLPPIQGINSIEPVASNLPSIQPVEVVLAKSTAPGVLKSLPLKGAWTNKLNFASSSISQPKASGVTIPGSKKPVLESSKEDNLRFPWAARMDPGARNLYRATSPVYMEDGTPLVTIPSNVISQGVENQKEYVLGQFYRCSPPPGGLVHAVVNRIWGRKCRIFVRKLDDSKFLFHIPDTSTRTWVLQRGLWHVDDCLMFVAPWSTADTFDLPEISTIPVWVTLKNIPNTLYSIPGISHIASGLGAPMATYKPRLDPSLMGEAKILVEVELSKAFPPRIAAADKKGNISMVSVEYAWIPAKCAACGQLGHKASRCMHLQPPIASLIKVTSTNVATPAKESTSTTTGLVSPFANHFELPIVDIPQELEAQVDTSLESEVSPIKVTGYCPVNAVCNTIAEDEVQFVASGTVQRIGDLTVASETVQRGLESANTQKKNILSECEVASVLANNMFSRLVNSFSDGDSLPSDEESVESDESDSVSGMIDNMSPSGQRLLRERPVQPSIKAKEAQLSSYARGRGRRGRGSRGRGDRGRG